VIGSVAVQRYDGSFTHKHRRCALRPPTVGEDSVAESGAGDTAGGAVQAHGFPEDVFEEGEGFQDRERQWLVSEREGLFAELGLNSGIAGEVEERVGEGDARTVTGREEDVECNGQVARHGEASERQ